MHCVSSEKSSQCITLSQIFSVDKHFEQSEHAVMPGGHVQAGVVVAAVKREKCMFTKNHENIRKL